MDALGTLLGRSWAKMRKKVEGDPKFEVFWGRGFGRVLAILNVLVKNLRLHRPSHRFFYFFCIVRELLAKARTLNFVAPVDVLKGFSMVDVSGRRDVDVKKKHQFRDNATRG